MTDYSNWKILKTDLPEKQKEYEMIAAWCNDYGKHHIEDDGTYYKLARNPEPTPPSEDKLKAKVRAVRDSYLLATDFTQLPDAPFTSEEKLQYAQYRQYLRDYTEGENWWLNNPKTFEEWEKTLDNILD